MTSYHSSQGFGLLNPLYVLIVVTNQRYPRSAARAVKSCARRHAITSGGGQSCPFPVHAGDITRVIAGLLSLEAPSSAGATGVEAGRGGSATAPAAGGVEGAESGDVRALRLAALPTWRLLDAPNAFQEAFVCAVLVMEAAQTPGMRSTRPLRVTSLTVFFFFARAGLKECYSN